MLRFGIDLGGTKIEGAILDERGAIVFRERIATEAAGGYAHIVGRIAMLYRRMAASAGTAPHRLGIGTPGSLSPVTGRLRNSNTVSMNGQPLVADLEAALGRPFTIENDANCFALAEALQGAGRNNKVVFGVIMGTGCGGGIVWDGVVHRGRNAIGGEWGHHVIDPAGARCYCGANGCAETFISGSGLERAYRACGGAARTAHAIVALADANDVTAAAVMATFYDRFGRAIANLLNILDPDIVVLGGGLSNIDALYTHGVEAVRRQVFSDQLTTPIVGNKLGDSAGVIGAALIGT
ncbi:MAG: ROK family protein [Burkholderiales bacterium]